MMAINHECYISLEVAKLLKAAGFNWECLSAYFRISGGVYKFHQYANDIPLNWNKSTDYSAPTLDVTQRWLREVKGVYLDIDTHFNPAGVWFSYVINILDSDAKFDTYSNCLGAGHSFNEYEEAQEAGIKKALELILEKGE